MAVDSLAKAAATVLERNHIPIYQNKATTMPTALSDTAVGTEIKHKTSRTKEAIKRAKLKRERAELVKHLYSVIDTTRQTSYTDSTTLSDRESNESDEILDCYDYELQFHRRKTEISRRTKRERALPTKEQKFVEFCRQCQNPENITLERGHKKAIRVKFYQFTKQMSRDSNRREQNLERKANIEKKLRKLGLKRLEVTRPNSRITSGDHNRDDPAVESFALRAGNAPNGIQDMVGFLLSLQFREVTPEDYEFLLRLDESVPTKTVSGKRLASLREDTASDEHTHDVCGVCMENYEVGQTRKNLPCGHVFHSNCIDKWLGQSSTSCPLDGLEI